MKATFAETITTSRNCYFWDERDAALCLCSMVAALDEGLATYIILLVWGEKKKTFGGTKPRIQCHGGRLV